jgi:hypothetical protein
VFTGGADTAIAARASRRGAIQASSGQTSTQFDVAIAAAKLSLQSMPVQQCADIVRTTLAWMECLGLLTTQTKTARQSFRLSPSALHRQTLLGESLVITMHSWHDSITDTVASVPTVLAPSSDLQLFFTSTRVTSVALPHFRITQPINAVACDRVFTCLIQLLCDIPLFVKYLQHHNQHTCCFSGRCFCCWLSNATSIKRASHAVRIVSVPLGFDAIMRDVMSDTCGDVKTIAAALINRFNTELGFRLLTASASDAQVPIVVHPGELLLPYDDSASSSGTLQLCGFVQQRHAAPLPFCCARFQNNMWFRIDWTLPGDPSCRQPMQVVVERANFSLQLVAAGPVALVRTCTVGYLSFGLTEKILWFL